MLTELPEALFVRHARRYWADFAACATITWAGLLGATLAEGGATRLALALVSSLALYRGLYFVHELAHLKPGELPGFKRAWNLLLGYPFFFPSATYTETHRFHHRVDTYGTRADPEYLPFRKNGRVGVLTFFARIPAIPALLAARFLVGPPLGALSPRLRAWLDRRASSTGINARFERPRMSRAETRELRRAEASCLALGCSFLVAVWGTPLLASFLIAWYSIACGALALNFFRTAVAHRYQGEGLPFDLSGQLEDTHTLTGGIWVELWAPLGSRFHELHHLHPRLPYHSARVAHGQLNPRRYRRGDLLSGSRAWTRLLGAPDSIDHAGTIN